MIHKDRHSVQHLNVSARAFLVLCLTMTLIPGISCSLTFIFFFFCVGGEQLGSALSVVFSCGVSAQAAFLCAHSCMCTSDTAKLGPSSSFSPPPQGSRVSWRTPSHEEIEVCSGERLLTSHFPRFPSVFSRLICSSVLLKALQLTSGLSSGHGALLLAGQLNRRAEV